LVFILIFLIDPYILFLENKNSWGFYLTASSKTRISCNQDTLEIKGERHILLTYCLHSLSSWELCSLFYCSVHFGLVACALTVAEEQRVRARETTVLFPHTLAEWFPIFARKYSWL